MIAALTHAVKAAATKRVLLVREQVLPLPPTWKAANARYEELKRCERASIVEVVRGDLVTALAMHDLTVDASSQDLQGADGRALSKDLAYAWIERVCQPAKHPLAFSELSLGSVSPPPQPPPPLGAYEVVEHVVRSLRLASVERVVREARLLHPQITRDRTLTELRANKALQWLGTNLVHLPLEGRAP